MNTVELNGLNEEQLKPATDTEGAILVTAGAGSGKTRLLTSRICHLIGKNVHPYNILAITFTNKAANEMKERINQMLPGVGSSVWISTFHSMCVRILRENISYLGGFNKNFTIYDANDSNKVLKKVCKENNIKDELADKVSFHLSNFKNMGISMAEYKRLFMAVREINLIAEIIEKYNAELKANNALDFDDLILKTVILFETTPEVLLYYQQRFKYIHVDEFQDTNTIQYKLCKLLAGFYKNIFVVGDEDQCIYSWRGANIGNLIAYRSDFLGVRCYKLEQNYRSTKNVLKIANQLIKNNTSRIEKVLWTENEAGEKPYFHVCNEESHEGEWVAKKVYDLIVKGVNPSQIAILMRMSATSRIFEEKLLNYNISFAVSGIFKFFERQEVKNVLAYLNLMINPRDNESVKRIINVPKRGIGVASIEKLEELARTSGVSIYELIVNSSEGTLQKSLAEKVLPLKQLFVQLEEIYENESLAEFAKQVVEKTNIKSMYDSTTDEGTDKLLNIEQLLESIKSYEQNNPGAGLNEYLQSVTLESSADGAGWDESKVLISTIHASKGLEFDYVFIIGAEQGIFPSYRSFDDPRTFEEERRLMYVAITRARKNVIISKASSRYIYGDRKPTVTSCFIEESGIEQENKMFNPFAAAVTAYDGSSVYGKQKIYANESFGMNNYARKAKEFVSDNLSDWQKKTVTEQKKDYSDYTEGSQVLHPKFGVGTIINADLKGDNASVRVEFPGFGMKTLSLSMAPLKVLKRKN